MANPDDAVVELQEEGTIEVPVDTNKAAGGVADSAAGDGGAELEAEPVAPKPARKREPKAPSAEEQVAQKAFEEALQNEQRLRKSAQDTADAERRRAEEADARRQQREQELRAAHDDVDSERLAGINAGIEAAKRDIENSEAEIRTAFEAGEFGKAAAAQTKNSRAVSALDRFEARKADFEASVNRKPTTTGRVVEQPQQYDVHTTSPPSSFERYVAGFAPAAQAWLRSHPECVPGDVGGNPQMNSKMMQGHYAALAQNVTPNTDEYFRVIEEATGHRKPPAAAASAVDEPDDAPAPPKKTARPSAPVSREPPNAQGEVPRSRSVRLTVQQQEAARMSFPQMQPAQAYAAYARNLVDLEAEGKLGRTTH